MKRKLLALAIVVGLMVLSVAPALADGSIVWGN